MSDGKNLDYRTGDTKETLYLTRDVCINTYGRLQVIAENANEFLESELVPIIQNFSFIIMLLEKVLREENEKE